jgi:hypothetical protein
MLDRNLEADHVAELPLERREVGVAALIFHRAEPELARLAAADQLLGLANREAALHDLVGERLRMVRSDQRPSMAHAQAPLAHQILHALGKIE